MDELDCEEWKALYESVTLQIRALDETGCPNVRAMAEAEPEKFYPRRLAAYNRSYVMARWIMLDRANTTQDIDAIRVYDRFIADPDLNHRLIDPTISALRFAGYKQTAEVITRKHFARYDTINSLVMDESRRGPYWDETNVEILYAVFVTSEDSVQKHITKNFKPILSLMHERGITSAGELRHVIESTDGGSAVLFAGTL